MCDIKPGRDGERESSGKFESRGSCDHWSEEAVKTLMNGAHGAAYFSSGRSSILLANISANKQCDADAAGAIPWRHSCACQTVSWPVHVWSWHSVPSADALRERATDVGQVRAGAGAVTVSHETKRERRDKRKETGMGNGGKGRQDKQEISGINHKHRAKALLQLKGLQQTVTGRSSGTLRN